ncbi:hypothetical protein STENM223S_08160 [Streptomyces tendae]
MVAPRARRTSPGWVPRLIPATSRACAGDDAVAGGAADRPRRRSARAARTGPITAPTATISDRVVRFGLAPPSQADIVRRALAENRPPRALRDALRAAAARRTS